MISRPQLDALFHRLPGLQIGVIGDFALDVYWTLRPAASVPSIETGRPTLPVAGQRYSAGAAGNVVANLSALTCGRIAAFGVVGPDPWGRTLAGILRGLGADAEGLIAQERDWATVAYIKPHVDGVEQDRIDFGDFNALHNDTADRLLDRLAASLDSLDVLIVNAQARSGIHNERLRQGLADLLRSRPDGTYVVDSRDPLALYDACALKINDREAVRVFGGDPAPDRDVPRERAIEAAEKLYAGRSRPVFVTRGAAGMVVRDASGLAEVPGVVLEGEVDTVGAGDAALAGIAVALAGGLAPAVAACVGNLAAAVCAGKTRQTGTASPSEIRALVAWGT